MVGQLLGIVISLAIGLVVLYCIGSLMEPECKRQHKETGE